MRKKGEPKIVIKTEKIEEPKFALDEFSVQYTIPTGVDRQFEGWLVEQLNDRFPSVSCDLELSTRIRRITFRR